MKVNPTSLLPVVVVLAMLGSHTYAQNAAPPEATVEEDSNKGENDAADTTGAEKVAWLGVMTGELPPALASQLDLAGGAFVGGVVPDSPAARGGLETYDIITAIGETQISSPRDLSAAIRALKPGSEVGMSVIHKAKPTELKVTLGERPEMPLDPRPGIGRGDIDPTDADAVRKEFERVREEMQLRFKDLFPRGVLPPGVGNGADIVRMSNKSTSFSDGDGTITITTKDGETQIEATDADGKLLYKGPAETEDDRKKLPPGVLEKLKRFEEMNLDIDIQGFEDKFVPPALKDPEPKPAEQQNPALTSPRGKVTA